MSENAYEGPAIVELMGHRQRGGLVREVEQYGTTMLRIDIPVEDGEPVTEFYGGSAIYCARPVTQEVLDKWLEHNGDARPPSPMGWRSGGQLEFHDDDPYDP